MGFFKKIVTRKPISVLDCGSEKAAILIGAKLPGGDFEVIGAGESNLCGVEDGEIRNLGDAAESVMEARRKAEASAGIKVDSVTFNFDDASMQSSHVHGVKTLTGEGEIRASDLEETVDMAERHVSQFEKRILYCKPVGFLVDDRDKMDNPIGVFGRKLDVEVHVLQARSDLCDAWQKLIRRCHLSRGSPVPSALSTAYGILSVRDREKQRLILDAGRDFLNIFIFGKNALIDNRVFLTKTLEVRGFAHEIQSAAKDLIEKNAGVTEILFTGELAVDEKWAKEALEGLGLPYSKAGPLGVTRLTEPRYASLAGLFYAADELEKKTPFLQTGRGVFQSIKDKALTTLQEYF